MLEELMPVLIDVNAEYAVLGCLMSEPDCVEEVLELVRESDFAEPMHRRVFRAIAELTRERKPADPITVRQSLRSAGADDRLGDALLGMCEVVACRANALYYAGIVRELSRRRRIFGKIQEWLRRLGELKADGLVDEMERFAAEARADAPDDVTVSSFDAVESSLPEVSWLWEGWLPRGFLTVLASSPGEGKSGVALEIVRRVLAGGAWPDGAAVSCGTGALACDEKEATPAEGGWATSEKATPGGGRATSARRVLYVDTEAAGAILRGRVRAWGIPAEGLNVFAATDPAPGLAELSLDDPRDWRRLARGVTELAPSLVVVDSLSGAHGRDENSSEMRGLLLRLARLARDSRSAFLVVHHLRKKSALEPDGVTLDRLRGSGTIAQFARCVWAVDRPDANDPRRRLVQIKNNLAAFPDPIGFAVTGEGIRFSDAPREPHVETAAERAAEFLMTVLRKRPMPASQVLGEAEECGHSRSNLYNAARLLKIRKIKLGLNNGWLWSLPASAIEEAAEPAASP